MSEGGREGGGEGNREGEIERGKGGGTKRERKRGAADRCLSSTTASFLGSASCQVIRVQGLGSIGVKNV